MPPSHSPGLTEDELASRAGVSVDRVQRLAKLGVVQASEPDGTFRPIDVQRIRVAEAFVGSGLAVEDLGRLVAEGHVTFPNLEAVFGEPVAASDTTLADFASRLGRDPDLLRRVIAQLGLPQPEDDHRLRADDLEFLREFLAVFDARDVGLGDDFLLRAAPPVRRFDQASRRVVERDDAGGAGTGNRTHVGRRARAACRRALYRYEPARRLAPSSPSRGGDSRQHRREHRKRHGGDGHRPPPRSSSSGDWISRSLRIHGPDRARGDQEAARLAVQLSDLVQETAASRSGRTVKSLGDGVMLHFREPGDAVSAALELVDAIPRAGLPAARVGIAF